MLLIISSQAITNFIWINYYHVLRWMNDHFDVPCDQWYDEVHVLCLCLWFTFAINLMDIVLLDVVIYRESLFKLLRCIPTWSEKNESSTFVLKVPFQYSDKYFTMGIWLSFFLTPRMLSKEQQIILLEKLNSANYYLSLIKIQNRKQSVSLSFCSILMNPSNYCIVFNF